MNTKVKTSFLRILLTLLIFSVALSAVCFLFSNKMQTLADSEITARLFLPQTELENYSLNSPTEVYSDDSVTAIIQNGNSELIVNYNGKNTRISGNKILDVDRYDANSLIFSSDSKLYKITLNNPSTYVIDDSVNKITLNDMNGESVSYFDVNQDYLVTAYQTYMQVYAIEGGAFNEITDTQINIADGTNVAINQNNTLFFVSGTKNSICTLSCDTLSVEPNNIATTVPQKIVANGEFIYYTYSNDIYRIPVSGGQATELKFEQNNPFDLGSISAPSAIALKGENLLVVEGNTVQEFVVDGNNFVFTGYAIASGKSAYNRVSINATDVEKYGNTLAVLDGNKITVINTDTANQYERGNFINVNVSTVDRFALGNGKILLANSGTAMQIIDINDSTKNKDLVSPVNVKDVCYQSGKFYILGNPDADKSAIYSISETDENYAISTVATGLLHEYSTFTVDVFGNLHLADNTNKIYKHEKANGYQTPSEPTVTASTDVQKLLTDLGGTLFVLDGGELKYFDQTLKSVDITYPLNDAVKSFAMDIISGKVYALHINSEFMTVADGIENLALDDVVLTDKFATTANTADFDNLKFYKPINGANAYSITKDQDGIKFNGLIEERNEYVYICDLTVSNSYRSITLRALAGQTEIVLVNTEETFSIDMVKVEPIPPTAFTTTGVNMYYIPVITKDLEYSLSNANGVIRLNKGCEIHPEQRFTFLGNEFYFASVEVDGNTVKGYIPTAFTVEVLSEDFKWDEYSFVKVKATTLFEDENLTNAIAELSDNQVARLISVKDDVAYIAVKIDGQWVQGYVKESDVKNEPSLAVRNALIIIAVAACVCATTAYFILRKKED
ncbi:MAG: hypothetical protein IJD54_02900 [Clostridia bacterium]|nr:hypothetical protein [Clostridia bacterium]